MGIVGACIVFVLFGIGLGCFAMWAVKIKPMEQKIEAANEGYRELSLRLETQSVTNELKMRVDVLETFMRPERGELAPRVAQLEKQISIDGFTYRAQIKNANSRYDYLDERLIAMAKDMGFSRYQAAKTMPPPAA